MVDDDNEYDIHNDNDVEYDDDDDPQYINAKRQFA